MSNTIKTIAGLIQILIQKLMILRTCLRVHIDEQQ